MKDNENDNGNGKYVSDSSLLKKSFEKSVSIFEKVLDGNAISPQQLQVALMATKIYVKSKAVENQKAMLIYQIARDYSQDKEELRAILRDSIPNMKFIERR